MSKWLAKFQAWTHASKQEITAVATLLGLTTAAAVIGYYRTASDAQTRQYWLTQLDSLAQLPIASIDPDAEDQPVSNTPQDSTDTATERHARHDKRKQPPTQPIDINTASKHELMRLPGIGEVMASRIVAARKERPFSKPDDLLRVPGIGKKKFEQIRPYIRTGTQ